MGKAGQGCPASLSLERGSRSRFSDHFSPYLCLFEGLLEGGAEEFREVRALVEGLLEGGAGGGGSDVPEGGGGGLDDAGLGGREEKLSEGAGGGRISDRLKHQPDLVAAISAGRAVVEEGGENFDGRGVGTISEEVHGGLEDGGRFPSNREFSEGVECLRVGEVLEGVEDGGDLVLVLAGGGFVEKELNGLGCPGFGEIGGSGEDGVRADGGGEGVGGEVGAAALGRRAVRYGGAGFAHGDFLRVRLFPVTGWKGEGEEDEFEVFSFQFQGREDEA